MSRLKERLHQYEEEHEPRRIRIHLTGLQAFLCILVFFLSLTCVFVAGVLTGRGVPKEAKDSMTLTGAVYRLLGVRPSEEEPVPNASETWIPAEKILGSLESEKELASVQKSAPPVTPRAAAPPPPATGRNPALPAIPESPSVAEQTAPLQPAQEEPLETSLSTPTTSDSYALMVASMRRQENAVALMDRLKKKGHKAAMERIAVGDQDVWYRVILEGFDSRQKALEYAARLNKEEKLQAIVIRREGSGSGEN